MKYIYDYIVHSECLTVVIYIFNIRRFEAKSKLEERIS